MGVTRRSRRTMALALLAFVFAGCSQGSDPDADYYKDHYYEPKRKVEAVFDAPERSHPGNRGTCRVGPGCAPLTIHTSGESDFYLVLRDSRSNRKAASIFIDRGKTYRGGMPNGSYDLYYTTGRSWYGDKLFFGPSASVEQADSLLRFYETPQGRSGVELTLYAVMDGNMTTSQAGPADLR